MDNSSYIARRARMRKAAGDDETAGCRLRSSGDDDETAGCRLRTHNSSDNAGACTTKCSLRSHPGGGAHDSRRTHSPIAATVAAVPIAPVADGPVTTAPTVTGVSVLKSRNGENRMDAAVGGPDVRIKLEPRLAYRAILVTKRGSWFVFWRFFSKKSNCGLRSGGLVPPTSG